MLVALRALDRLALPADSELAAARFEFRGPVFPMVEYTVETIPREDGCEVRVLDLGRVLLHGDVTFRSSGNSDLAQSVGAASTFRSSAASRAPDDLQAGLTAEGSWAPDVVSFDELLGRSSLAHAQAAVLLWTSYLVGMELPGERATFWKAALDFAPRRSVTATPFQWRARLLRFDERVGAASIQASVSTRTEMVAEASLEAFVRDETPPVNLDRLRELLPPGDPLDGQVAVVIGGSRGLGAGIVQALALSGCRVVLVYSRSRAAAEGVSACVPGAIELLQGDASDPAWCKSVLHPRVVELGRLDLVVCNAAPTIRPLPFRADSVERISCFVKDSLSLVATPLGVLVDALAHSSGTLVAVSSSAVETHPPEWPHYVAAKSALEGLVQWSAAQHPSVRCLVVRPPKLLTNQMNTVLGRVGAAAVEPVAVSVVRCLLTPRSPGVEILAPGG